MENQKTPRQRAIFCVGEEPYCLWDPDIISLNFEFLDRIDPQYYEFIADSNRAHLDSDNKHRSATAMRSGFYHGLETLFALVCSALQAPDSIAGWMLKYQNSLLRKMISSITSHTADFPHKLIIYPITWNSISKSVFEHINLPPPEKDAYVALFAQLWSRFAEIFVDESNIAEYNSIKHGLRTGSGGFALAMGIEEQFGVPAPADKMHLIGSNEFSHSFYRIQPVGNLKQNPKIKLVHHSLAWSPSALGYALELISFSLQNLIVFIKILNGVDPSTVPFAVPEDKESFNKPFEESPSLPSMSLQFETNIPDNRLYTREQLIDIVEKNKSATKPSA